MIAFAKPKPKTDDRVWWILDEAKCPRAATTAEYEKWGRDRDNYVVDQTTFWRKANKIHVATFYAGPHFSEHADCPHPVVVPLFKTWVVGGPLNNTTSLTPGWEAAQAEHHNKTVMAQLYPMPAKWWRTGIRDTLARWWRYVRPALAACVRRMARAIRRADA